MYKRIVLGGVYADKAIEEARTTIKKHGFNIAE
jgi:hypothetical protein